MKKYARILIAVIFLLGLGVAAKAETRPELVAKMPFQFVVGGKTLPAGTYKVSSLSADPYGVLLITNVNNADSVFVLPFSIGSPSSHQPHVDFKQAGKQYLLSSIQTPDFVYNIAVDRSRVILAAAKPHDTVPVSGGASGN